MDPRIKTASFYLVGGEEAREETEEEEETVPPTSPQPWPNQALLDHKTKDDVKQEYQTMCDRYEESKD